MTIDYIETYTGKRFKPLAPVTADICIEDIAHALSNQCRFAGHTMYHYSVAQHCVDVCMYLEESGYSKTVQLWGLLHDASEAYLVDLPSPLKHSPEFLPYRMAEGELMLCICERFGIPFDEPPAVKDADLRLLAVEASQLLPFKSEHWGHLKHSIEDDGDIEVNLTRLTPYGAEQLYLREFRRLTQCDVQSEH